MEERRERSSRGCDTLAAFQFTLAQMAGDSSSSRSECKAVPMEEREAGALLCGHRYTELPENENLWSDSLPHAAEWDTEASLPFLDCELSVCVEQCEDVCK